MGINTERSEPTRSLWGSVSKVNQRVIETTRHRLGRLLDARITVLRCGTVKQLVHHVSFVRSLRAGKKRPWPGLRPEWDEKFQRLAQTAAIRSFIPQQVHNVATLS